jgi:hypothetical protein
MRPTFHMGIGGDILGYYCSNSPNKSRKWYLATQYYLIGELYWRTAGDALKHRDHSLPPSPFLYVDSNRRLLGSHRIPHRLHPANFFLTDGIEFIGLVVQGWTLQSVAMWRVKMAD